MPGIPANLRLTPLDGGVNFQLTWDDATNADDYVVFSDTAPDGMFETVAGIAQSGATGLTVAVPSGNELYLVAGRNPDCGVGPKR